jgi:hypothetical protein
MRLGLACLYKIGDVQVHSASRVGVLHDLDHSVALFVDLDASEVYLPSSELSHLVLNLVPLWGTMRVVIATGRADVSAVPWSIKDMEGCLN